MISETVDFLELRAFLGINVYVLGVGADGNFGSVRVKREGDNRTGEQLMHLCSGHFQLTGRGGSQPLMDHSLSTITEQRSQPWTAMGPEIEFMGGGA